MLIFRGNRVRSALVSILPSLLLLMPSSGRAQETPAPPPPAETKKSDAKANPPMEQEIIVTGRHGEPDFQEQQEYHAKEYRRLKEIYDPDPLPVIRGDRLVRMPEVNSSTVRNKPTVTEKQW